MTRTRTLLLLSLVVVGFLMVGTVAKADPISITLDAPFQYGSDLGQTLSFTTTVSNLDAANTVYLNGDAFNLDSPLSLDDSGFWANAPLSLAPLETSGDFELFTVTVPHGTPSGLYTGTFTILGGATPSDLDVIGVADFNVYVTPEPSSLVLLGTGVVGLIGTVRRKVSQRG